MVYKRLVLILVVLLTIPANVFADSTTGLYISQINYAGSIGVGDCKEGDVKVGRCWNDKWLEISNSTSVAVSLSGYKLVFKNTNTLTDTFTFGAGIVVAANSTLLVAQKEAGLILVLDMVGVKADVYSGKIKNVSNNDTKTVQVDLVSPTGTVVSDVDLSASYIKNLESQVNMTNERHSVEYHNGIWIMSRQSLYGNNFATPPHTAIVDSSKLVDAIVPMPIVTLSVIPVATSVVQTNVDTQVASVVHVASTQVVAQTFALTNTVVQTTSDTLAVLDTESNHALENLNATNIVNNRFVSPVPKRISLISPALAISHTSIDWLSLVMLTLATVVFFRKNLRIVRRVYISTSAQNV